MHSDVVEALALFRSVIKCGEPWTTTCQDAYTKAIAALAPPEGLAARDDVLEEAEASAPVQFAVAYVEGYLEGEPEELQRNWRKVKAAALAARDDVLEEAAKVAEGEQYAEQFVRALEAEGIERATVYNEACTDIAAAIRVLKNA